MRQQQLDQLSAQLESFCAAQRIPYLSADEILIDCRETLSALQRAWLHLFVARWDHVAGNDEFDVPSDTLDYLYDQIRAARCTGRREILATIEATSNDLDIDSDMLIDAYDRNEQGFTR